MEDEVRCCAASMLGEESPRGGGNHGAARPSTSQHLPAPPSTSQCTPRPPGFSPGLPWAARNGSWAARPGSWAVPGLHTGLPAGLPGLHPGLPGLHPGRCRVEDAIRNPFWIRFQRQNGAPGPQKSLKYCILSSKIKVSSFSARVASRARFGTLLACFS